MSMVWGSTTKWWQGAADSNDAGLTRLQVVRLAPQVGFAIIGVARIDTDYEVRAMRLLCDPSQAPAVLWGLPDLPFGGRQLQATAAWTPPAIAAGGTAQINIALTGARPGDYAAAAYSLATSGIVFLAQVGATDVVTVTAYNRSGGSVTLNPGTVRARVVKA
jgi:hypothetical protein